MPTKMKLAGAEAALSRLLEALEGDLIDAADEEVIQAAKDLGMNPAMKGSAAFLGLKYPAQPQLADFFGIALDERLPQPRHSALRPASKAPDETE